MAVAARRAKIDDLMTSAADAMQRGDVVDAERDAEQALRAAREERELERMAEIVPVLWSARAARLERATADGTVRFLEAAPDEEGTIEPGCVLVQPPLVGADARRLRLAALGAGVPTLVVCREPRSQLGLWPIVAIAPGATVRMKVPPPDDPEAPDVAWMLDAVQAIGDWAVEGLDAALAPEKRLDELMMRLDAIPDHEGLHEALVEACRALAAADAEKPTKPAKRTG